MSELDQLLERPTERIVRGALFAAIAIPAGAIVWDIVWSFGIISALVAYGIAVATVWLYQKGSGGVISIAGAFVISGIVVVTLVFSFWVGMVTDYAIGSAQVSGYGPIEVLGLPQFWQYFGENFGAILSDDALSLGISILFGALGTFRTLRRVFTHAVPVAPRDPYAEQFPKLFDEESGPSTDDVRPK
jgi:hypothetical protein